VRDVLNSYVDFFQLSWQELVRHTGRYSNDAQPHGLSMEIGEGRTVLFDVDDLHDGVLLCLLILEHHFTRAVSSAADRRLPLSEDPR